MITEISAFIFLALPIVGLFIVALACFIDCFIQLVREENDGNISIKFDKNELLNVASLTLLICFVIWLITFAIVGI